MFHPRCVLAGSVDDKEVTLPLRTLALSGTITDAVATLEWTLGYQNDLKDAVHALYFQAFLAPQAIVTAFTATHGDKEIISNVQKRPERVPHDLQALDLNLDASPLLYSVIFGSLQPEEYLTVRVTYVLELAMGEGEVCLALPTLPGYKDVQVDEFELKLEMSAAIDQVVCSTHAFTFERDGEKKGLVKLALDTDKDRADLLLKVHMQSETSPLVTVQEDDMTGVRTACVVHHVLPEVFGENRQEIIFLIDRSGSMDNGRLNLLKRTVPALLDLLPENAFFNVIGFGSSLDWAFPSSVPKNDENLDAASAALRLSEGDLGETKVFEALSAVFEKMPQETCLRQIFLFTDGVVDELGEVAALVRRNAFVTRCNVVLLNDGKHENLARTIARSGRGAVLAVHEERADGLAQQLSDFFKAQMRPALVDVRVDWGDMADDYAPFKHAPVLQGDSIRSVAQVKDDRTEGSVTLHGRTSKGAFKLTVPFMLQPTCEGSSLQKLFAARMIDDLEVAQSSFPHQGSYHPESLQASIEEKVYELSIVDGVTSQQAVLQPYVDTGSFDVPASALLPLDHRFIYDKDEKEKKETVSSGVSAGSFWASFGFSSDTALDKMLDSGEFTLEQLLEEDDFFSEAQSSNEKLVRFLTKPHAARKIFAAVAQPTLPKDDPEFQRMFICTEILALPLWDEALTTVYADGSQCMEQLFQTLQLDGLDEQRVFRICRVFAAFMGLDLDLFVDFGRSRRGTVAGLVKHMHCPSIADLMRALLKPEHGEKRANVLEWLYEGGVVEACLAVLAQPDNGKAQGFAADILNTLLAATKDVAPLLHRPYEREAVIDSLFSLMFAPEGMPAPSYLRGLSVLSNVVALLRAASSDQAQAHPTLALVVAKLDRFKVVIAKSGRERACSFGKVMFAGEPVIQTISFVESLVRVRIGAVDQALIQSDILTDCVEAIFRFPLNNFLHAAVEQLLTAVLSLYREDLSLKVALLQKTDLPSKLVTGFRKSQEKNERGQTTGTIAYGGHLYRISVALVAERHVPELGRLLDEHPHWPAFEKGEFLQQQALYIHFSRQAPLRT